MLRSDGLHPFRVLALLALPLLLLAAPRAARAEIVGVRATPTVISPNGDGVRDVVVFHWAVSTNPAQLVRYTITRSPSGFIGVGDTLGARPVGADSLVWNGTDSLGAVVPDGLYAMKVEEVAPDSSILSSGITVVRIDNTAPVVPSFDVPDTVVTVAPFTVSGIAADADTVILFRDGVRADTVTTSGTPLRFSFPLTLLAGHNRFSVQAIDVAGNLSPQTTDLDVLYAEGPDVGLPKATAFFSPNGDGVSDTTKVTFTLDAPTTELTVRIRRGLAPSPTGPDNTEPVAVLYDAPAAAGTYVFPWDGRDSTGTIAPDGSYLFAVHAESLSAEGAPIPATVTRYAPVRLDTTAPPAPVIDPAPPASVIRSSLELAIRVVESDSVRIFRNGILVTSEAVGTPSGTRTLHVPVTLVSGPNTFAVQALDFAGNVSALGPSVTVRFDTPIGFHAPERFKTGDAFSVNLGSSARSVAIELFTLRGDPVRQLASTATATHYELPWDLKDTAGAFVGDGPYVARLRVVYSSGTTTETRAAIVVVK
jgi:flagellar hook assembly protein FlgD